ncbi:MAG: undecaprenyldiphospho-muramoylpentapeptide beta-N-acetylglucosaminyltransferase [Lachnospiraceae bacterium]|nr:undecaprenyldiphospho-muramoylpentapeptide beta-N-acetylglucosaminyltransferase [Lachnospiraceae bacterium]
MKKILLTGGGTAGHVTPNIALIPHLRELGFEINYMGSYDGIERKLIEELGIPYFGIDSGKLRRYLSIQNLKDPIHILHGLNEAKKYMKIEKPDIVFSKGGFVAVPVIFAASDYHIPIVLHESDLTPGLANKLCIPKANKICYNFPETKDFLPKNIESIHTGLPVRAELLAGDASRGRELCGFTEDKPVLMVIGGSLGSVVVNEAIRNALPDILKEYQVVHVCGNGKLDESLVGTPGYKQFEYLNEELAHVFAAADIIVSRAGANVIHEILALNKPSILIPLDKNASRGDQILNAESFEKRGFSKVIREADLTKEALLQTIHEIAGNKAHFDRIFEEDQAENAARLVAEIIASTVR